MAQTPARLRRDGFCTLSRLPRKICYRSRSSLGAEGRRPSVGVAAPSGSLSPHRGGERTPMKDLARGGAIRENDQKSAAQPNAKGRDDMSNITERVSRDHRRTSRRERTDRSINSAVHRHGADSFDTVEFVIAFEESRYGIFPTTKPKPFVTVGSTIDPRKASTKDSVLAPSWSPRAFVTLSSLTAGRAYASGPNCVGPPRLQSAPRRANRNR